jgi:hypothetical protein
MSTPRPTVDVLGIGFGPSNLALALAIGDHNTSVPSDQRLTARFVEQQAAFGWHRGMLLEGATMQVSFLKDLVTMRDPTSPRSFLAYLRDKDRLADFINNKSLFPSRVEFHDYLEWAASGVEELVDYGTRAVAVHPVRRDDEAAVTELDVVLRDLATGERHTVRTRNLVPSRPRCSTSGTWASPRSSARPAPTSSSTPCSWWRTTRSTATPSVTAVPPGCASTACPAATPRTTRWPWSPRATDTGSTCTSPTAPTPSTTTPRAPGATGSPAS